MQTSCALISCRIKMSEAFNGGPLLFRWLPTHFFPTLKTPIEDKKRSTSTKWASGAGNRQYLSLKAAICATFHTCCSARSCNFFHSTANFELTTFKKKKFGVNHCNSAGCRPPGGNATHSGATNQNIFLVTEGQQNMLQLEQTCASKRWKVVG